MAEKVRTRSGKTGRYLDEKEPKDTDVKTNLDKKPKTGGKKYKTEKKEDVSK